MRLWPYAIAVLYAVAYSVIGILRLLAMHGRWADVAVSDQETWGTLHGLFELNTIQGIGFTTLLSFHFEPIFGLLAPLALVFHDSRYLAAVQAIGLGVTAVPVGWWARERLSSTAGWLIAPLVVLLHPVFAQDSAHLFAEIPLCVPFLAFALYFQLTGRWRWFFPCLVLALAVREEVAFVAMGMGLFALLVQRERRIGLATIGLGLGWAVLALGVLIPNASHGHGIFWAQDSFAYLGGGTPASLALNALTHPLAVLQHVFQPRDLWFVLFLVAPLGLLPVLGARVSWLALPTLGYLFISDSSVYTDPNYWYGSPTLPFLFFGAIEGVRFLGRWIPERLPATYMLAASSLMFWELGAGPGTRAYAAWAYTPDPRNPEIWQLFQSIPASASVSATPNLLPFLAQRRQVYIFPELLLPSDVYAVDLQGWDGWPSGAGNFDQYDQALRRVLQDPVLHKSYLGDGLVLLDHQVAPPLKPASAAFGDQLQLTAYDSPPVLEPGARARFVLRWRVLGPQRQAYTAFLHFGTATNDKLAQHDGQPWQGYFPTSEWAAGQEIDDPEWLDLPRSLPPGQYRLNVGWYWTDASGKLQNLTQPDGSTAVQLGPFAVSAR
ncbi:MAG: DUF2079 domain-containing protein [Chloroflexi bacterium]|nr:DUF2079 domain-containing protein [Chloroflexota bacterium]